MFGGRRRWRIPPPTRLADGFATLELLEPTPGVVRLLHQAHLDGASWMPPID